MTIPASAIVRVRPGVLAAAGSALDLNGLFLYDDPALPVGAVESYPDQTSVINQYGATSQIAQLAGIYFQGTDQSTVTPGRMLLARYNAAAVGAFLRSGSLASLTLAQLKVIPASTLTVSVNGTAKVSSSIDLSAATSFSDAAAKIQAAFTTPGFTVAWDTQRAAFVFQNTTTGAGDVIGYGSGAIATPLRLTQATSAVISNGAAAAVPATLMASIVAQTLNWGAFTVVSDLDVPTLTAFSAWTSSQGERFVFAGWDNDPNAEVSGNTTTWMAAVTAASYDGTVPSWGDPTHAAFVLAWIASLDFTRTNGRQTLAYKSQSGIVPSVTSAVVAAALTANGYNFYGSYATAKDTFNFYNTGLVSGKFDWADSYVNQVWLNANLQLAMVQLLVSVGSIPYNTDGYALIDGACNDPLSAAVNFGAIRTGISLSASQAVQIKNALGVDVSQTLSAQGYYLQIKDATAATRVARTSPPMTLYYMDGGSVQQLDLASIEVQ